MLIKIREGKMTPKEGIAYVKALLQTTQLMCLKDRNISGYDMRTKRKSGSKSMEELSVGWQAYAWFCRVKCRIYYECNKKTWEDFKRLDTWRMVFKEIILDTNIQPTKELMLSNCDAGEKLLKVPWTAGRPTQSILKEINPEYSLEKLMLKLKLQ